MTVQAEAKPDQIQRPSQVRKPQLGCVCRRGRIIEWWSCERDELCLARREVSLQQTIVGQPVVWRHEAAEELLRYIEVLEECLGRKAQMEMLPLQAGDVPDTEADVTALSENVGYKPQVTVEEGVRNFVDWYRDYMKV